MIWLASFPRSGNTFIRNILYEVYGIESSTFHFQTDYPVDPDYQKYEFVKTHELPSMVIPGDKHIPAVYIVRDGRDALVSMAHHRRDIVAPGSDFYQNLKEAIIADQGSFFGGWSQNVLQWIERADLIIRYEDLIKDPIGFVEKIRKIYNLPPPKIDKLPTFEQLKYGIPKYGAAKDQKISDQEKIEKSKKFFRRGQAGCWKEEMPDELFDLFWSYHGDVMEQMGYMMNGEINDPNWDFDYAICERMGMQKPAVPQRIRKVLIESNKIISSDNDGVKRYQVELLKGLLPLVENKNSFWQIDLFVKGKIYPLIDFRDRITRDFSQSEIIEGEERSSPQRKKTLIERAEQIIFKMVPRWFTAYLQRNNITIFHKSYEFVKMLIFICLNTIVLLKNFLINSVSLVTKDHRVSMKTINTYNDYDLIHLPLMHHYEPFKDSKTKILSTVHDLTHIYFPEYHTKINISNSVKGMKFLMDKQSYIIAVSESTKNDIVKEFQIPRDKLFMIYEAADRKKFNYKIHSDNKNTIRKKYGIPTDIPYIISLSTIEPRKNLKNTIRAFIKFIRLHPDVSLNLVIAGKKGWETNKLHLLEDGIPNRIIFTGFVDDKDISYLYSDAIAMSYLSFYEGFGLPPLEAMCCGAPVIYGDNSSLIEVVKDGGIPANPNDIDDIMEKFKKIYFDRELREQKSRAALKQSLKFSWRKTIIETFNVYNSLINE